MINNDMYIDTLFLTNGLDMKILDRLKEMNFLDSKFALKDMIKNYKLCFKNKDIVPLCAIIDLCLIDKSNYDKNKFLKSAYLGSWDIFNTFGTPCYDFGMICKGGIIADIVGKQNKLIDELIRLKRFIDLIVGEDFDEDLYANVYSKTTVVRDICDFMTTPITYSKNNCIKINDNYKLVEYDNGMLLVNTEYGYDQWVKIGFPIGNVYVSYYNIVLTGFGNEDTIIIRREYCNKIYEYLPYCYRDKKDLIDSKVTGYFINGERFLKLSFGDI